jgi:hypothetical protein
VGAFFARFRSGLYGRRWLPRYCRPASRNSLPSLHGVLLAAAARPAGHRDARCRWRERAPPGECTACSVLVRVVPSLCGGHVRRNETAAARGGCVTRLRPYRVYLRDRGNWPTPSVSWGRRAPERQADRTRSGGAVVPAHDAAAHHACAALNAAASRSSSAGSGGSPTSLRLSSRTPSHDIEHSSPDGGCEAARKLPRVLRQYPVAQVRGVSILTAGARFSPEWMKSNGQSVSRRGLADASPRRTGLPRKKDFNGHSQHDTP